MKDNIEFRHPEPPGLEELSGRTRAEAHSRQAQRAMDKALLGGLAEIPAKVIHTRAGKVFGLALGVTLLQAFLGGIKNAHALPMDFHSGLGHGAGPDVGPSGHTVSIANAQTGETLSAVVWGYGVQNPSEVTTIIDQNNPIVQKINTAALEAGITPQPGDVNIVSVSGNGTMPPDGKIHSENANFNETGRAAILYGSGANGQNQLFLVGAFGGNDESNNPILTGFSTGNESLIFTPLQRQGNNFGVNVKNRFFSGFRVLFSLPADKNSNQDLILIPGKSDAQPNQSPNSGVLTTFASDIINKDPAAPAVAPAAPAKPDTSVSQPGSVDSAMYTGMDINRPLETCPVITDIDAYYNWVNKDLQKDGAYLPFGPDTKLVLPMSGMNITTDSQGDMSGQIAWDSSILTSIKNPADLPYRHLEKYIVRYKYLNYTKLIFPDLWFEPGDGAKPSLLLSSFTFDYSYGYKYTDSTLKQLIKDWKATVPWYDVPPVVIGGNYANEADFFKLEIDTVNQFPDVVGGVKHFEETGDASSVAGKGVIFETGIVHQ